MSDLIIIHQSNQENASAVNFFLENQKNGGLYLWETCRRRLLFLDESSFHLLKSIDHLEVYKGLEAEVFLIKVLCGLKSPLIGETEVFGQFKKWWSELPESDFKIKKSSRIQVLYSTVKKIREDAICGMGSQSYGSLLRKKLTDHNLNIKSNMTIDFLGAGQLVEEIIPWIQKNWTYRIWCRNPNQVMSTSIGENSIKILKYTKFDKLNSNLVVAAPVSHEFLNQWISERSTNQRINVYDFRSDSMYFKPKFNYNKLIQLDDFCNEVASQKDKINEKIKLANNKIINWMQDEQCRAQVRPFGWDDL